MAHDDDPLMSLPGMRIGKRGIEKQFDKEIRGRAGASQVEVNAYGRIIRELGKDPGEPGEDVYLTIDRAGAGAGRPEAGRRKRRHGGDGRATMATSSRCPPRRALIPTGSMSG